MAVVKLLLGLMAHEKLVIFPAMVVEVLDFLSLETGQGLKYDNLRWVCVKINQKANLQWKKYSPSPARKLCVCNIFP